MNITVGKYVTKINNEITIPLAKSIVVNGNISQEVWTLWDTGSNVSCISERLVSKLSLNQINTVRHLVNDNFHIVPLYMIEVRLSDKFSINKLNVMASGISAPNVDLLIGMDVISHGRLEYISYFEPPILIFEIQ